MTTTIQTAQFPVHYADRDWTSLDVHDGAALGTITLYRAGEQVTVPAGDVHRNLYWVRSSFMNGLVTGSYGQPIVVTWEEAERLVARLTSLVGSTSPEGTVYSIEVAR